MKARSIDDIAKTEAEYWNENKLDRRKIKKLRRHAFHYSYKRESKFLQEKVKHFNGKDVLEIGSHAWVSWIKGNATPKSLDCINISEVELEKGISNAKNIPFEINFHLMDANTLTFKDEMFDVVYGGGESNVAVSLANYGVPVRFVTRIPENDIGQSAKMEMRKRGVETEFMIYGGDRLGIYFLETGAVSRGSKVVYDRAPVSYTHLTLPTICSV